jgi:hypothetical protein
MKKREKRKEVYPTIAGTPLTTYTVERIVCERNGLYYIKWKGYSVKDSTWEPPLNIIDKGLIKEMNLIKDKVELEYNKNGKPILRPLLIVKQEYENPNIFLVEYENLPFPLYEECTELPFRLIQEYLKKQ